MKHVCNYCNAKSNQNRDALVESGWSFADIRAPKRKYIQSCHNPLCQEKMHDEKTEQRLREKLVKSGFSVSYNIRRKNYNV